MVCFQASNNKSLDFHRNVVPEKVLPWRKKDTPAAPDPNSDLNNSIPKAALPPKNLQEGSCDPYSDAPEQSSFDEFYSSIMAAGGSLSKLGDFADKPHGFESSATDTNTRVSMNYPEHDDALDDSWSKNDLQRGQPQRDHMYLNKCFPFHKEWKPSPLHDASTVVGDTNEFIETTKPDGTLRCNHYTPSKASSQDLSSKNTHAQVEPHMNCATSDLKDGNAARHAILQLVDQFKELPQDLYHMSAAELLEWLCYYGSNPTSDNRTIGRKDPVTVGNANQDFLPSAFNDTELRNVRPIADPPGGRHMKSEQSSRQHLTADQPDARHMTTPESSGVRKVTPNQSSGHQVAPGTPYASKLALSTSWSSNVNHSKSVFPFASGREPSSQTPLDMCNSLFHENAKDSYLCSASSSCAPLHSARYNVDLDGGVDHITEFESLLLKHCNKMTNYPGVQSTDPSDPKNDLLPDVTFTLSRNTKKDGLLHKKLSAHPPQGDIQQWVDLLRKSKMGGTSTAGPSADIPRENLLRDANRLGSHDQLYLNQTIFLPVDAQRSDADSPALRAQGYSGTTVPSLTLPLNLDSRHTPVPSSNSFLMRHAETPESLLTQKLSKWIISHDTWSKSTTQDIPSTTPTIKDPYFKSPLFDDRASYNDASRESPALFQNLASSDFMLNQTTSLPTARAHHTKSLMNPETEYRQSMLNSLLSPKGVARDTSDARHEIFLPQSMYEKVWEYCDPSGQIQGPFSTLQMAVWWEGRFFPSVLLMRYHSSLPWVPFYMLYPQYLHSRMPPFSSLNFPIVDQDGNITHPFSSDVQENALASHTEQSAEENLCRKKRTDNNASFIPTAQSTLSAEVTKLKKNLSLKKQNTTVDSSCTVEASLEDETKMMLDAMRTISLSRSDISKKMVEDDLKSLLGLSVNKTADSKPKASDVNSTKPPKRDGKPFVSTSFSPLQDIKKNVEKARLSSKEPQMKKDNVTSTIDTSQQEKSEGKPEPNSRALNVQVTSTKPLLKDFLTAKLAPRSKHGVVDGVKKPVVAKQELSAKVTVKQKKLSWKVLPAVTVSNFDDIEFPEPAAQRVKGGTTKPQLPKLKTNSVEGHGFGKKSKKTLHEFITAKTSNSTRNAWNRLPEAAPPMVYESPSVDLPTLEDSVQESTSNYLKRSTKLGERTAISNTSQVPSLSNLGWGTPSNMNKTTIGMKGTPSDKTLTCSETHSLSSRIPPTTMETRTQNLSSDAVMSPLSPTKRRRAEQLLIEYKTAFHPSIIDGLLKYKTQDQLMKFLKKSGSCEAVDLASFSAQFIGVTQCLSPSSNCAHGCETDSSPMKYSHNHSREETRQDGGWTQIPPKPLTLTTDAASVNRSRSKKTW